MRLGNASVTVKRKFKKYKDHNTTESNVSEKKATNTSKPKLPKPKIVHSEPKPAADSFANLLDEWDESDEEMETPVKQKKSNHSKITNTTSEGKGITKLKLFTVILINIGFWLCRTL